jgi:hypothetical protein
VIAKPTTLILGAGASAPFGFPTGHDLLRQILSWADTSPGKTNPLLFEGFKPEEVDKFRTSLLKSGKTSVDAFLEHQPDFIPIGKWVMAMALIQFENEAQLFNPNKEHWYKYLFNRMNAKFDDFGQNKLSILTFNYDRSLEHYLWTALKNSYPKTPHECAKQLEKIPIIHLHGDLGELPVLSRTAARFYHPDVNTHEVKIAADRIKIIHEDVTKAWQFLRARKILSESEIICFLGFGYNEVNMERLGFDGESYRKASIFGSSLGFEQAEWSYVRQTLLRGHFNGTFLPAADALEYLRKEGIFLK